MTTLKRQIILDTETTGLDPKKGHRLTEIGCLEMIDRQLTGVKFHTYINPERQIDKEASKITGLTNEFLNDKPIFAEIAGEFIDFLRIGETELIIHNAPFDLGFLNEELSKLKHPFCPLEDHLSIIDTLVMARRLHPGQRNNLDVLCARYKIDNAERQYHGALLDAILLAKVYLAMTAGQTALPLGMESESLLQKTEFKVNRIARDPKRVLTVVRATEEECALHETMMQLLEKV